MITFNEYLQEQLKNPEIKAAYEELEPAYVIVQAMIDARNTSGMTQKQLAERSGINQADISRLENGNGNPSIRTLQRLATAMGMRLKICFEPEMLESSVSSSIPKKPSVSEDTPINNVISLMDYIGHSGTVSNVTSTWQSVSTDELEEG